MRIAKTRRARRSCAGVQPMVLVLIALLSGVALLFGARRLGWLSAEDVAATEGAVVQRGPLRISVVERGNLKAADAISLKSEVEGQTTILYLIPEGTIVEEGTLLCELDATALIDERFEQEISVRNAEAAFIKSKQTHEIQKSQNDSDIKKAEQALYFAEVDLEKFREGERKKQEAEAEEAIQLGEEERARAEETLEWSQKLFEKGFLTNTELKADRLSLSRAQINLEQAKRNKDLLVRFQLPRDESELASALEEAKRELERVKLQAEARIVDYAADMETNEAKLTLEREEFSKLELQIRKAKLVAPRRWMVVYAQEDGGRWGSGEPIKEGTEVRERQEIITIPSAGGMIAQVSLHESVLKQVDVGQKAVIKVDALTGKEFPGAVRFVSVMADQGSWWANPNARLYRTEVTIDEPTPDMRPGMSCAIEILVEEIPDALFIPVQASFRRGSQNVAFVRARGAIEERPIEVGRYNDRWVQILSGLTDGETVLLAPPPGFATRASEDEEGEEGQDGEEEPRVEGAPDSGPGRGPGGPGIPQARAEGERGGGGDHQARGERGEREGGEKAAEASEADREAARKRFSEASEEGKKRMVDQYRQRGGGDGGGDGGGEAKRGSSTGG